MMMPQDEGSKETTAQDPEQGPGEQQGGANDPMTALGQGIAAMVQGLAKAPPEVQKAAQGVQAAFQQLMDVLGGGGGPQPLPQGAQMQGGNPNAVPVR